MSDDRSTMHRVATTLSVVGHPFVLIPVTVTVTVHTSWPGIGVAVVTVLVMLAVIVSRVRAGRWSDHDVSDVKQRRSFYPMAIGVVGVSAGTAWLLGAPLGVVRGFGVGMGLLVTASVITWWTKISLHTMFGAFCATTMVTAGVGVAVTFVMVVLVVGWSRVALGRHTIGQVVVGGVVGAVGGAALVLVNTLA